MARAKVSSTETETKQRVKKGTKAPKAEKATKATKKTSKATKKESKKSNIPAIKRPRSITTDSWTEYMVSVHVNLEHRIGELEEMHDAKKCPHKAIQHLRACLKECEYMQKRIMPVIKPKRKQTDKKNNILMKKTAVSPALAKFLKLDKNEQVSRSEVNTAITMYINVKDVDAVPAEKKKWLKRMNPDGKRNLQSSDNGAVIVPDKALSTLLDYPAYQKKVKAGKQVWNRKDKETGERKPKVEDNDQLTYAVVQHLLAPHFKNGAPRGGKKDEPVVEESEAESEEHDDDDDADDDDEE